MTSHKQVPQRDSFHQLRLVDDTIPNDISMIQDPLYLFVSEIESFILNKHEVEINSRRHDVVIQLHQQRFELIPVERTIPTLKFNWQSK